MRKLIVLLTAVALCGALAATALAGTKRVKVGDNFFLKDTSGTPKLKISKGTKLKFVWRGDSPHNVRVAKGPMKFDSGIKRSGSYRKKFRRKGKYLLVCDVHGRADQSMRVVVR